MDRTTGAEGGSAANAASAPKGDFMSNPAPDIFDNHYRRLREDPELRQRVIKNPAEGLKEHFGFVPGDGKCRIEVIVQDPDTITILLPTPPEANESANFGNILAAASSRIYDVLFRAGIGGFFIPSTDMTWVLRDFRSKAVAK